MLDNLEWGWDNARAVIGMAVIVLLVWALSENRRLFPWKLVLGSIAVMYGFTLLLFGVPLIRRALLGLNAALDVLVAATREGTRFVFGALGDQPVWETIVGQPGPIFIFQLLPLIITIGSLSAILWHWGVLKWITKAFALVFQRTMGLGGATSLSVAANIFMGQTEAPLLIKPYLRGMTRSEIFIIMVTGFATIAGSVLVIYTQFLAPVMPAALAHLITVSIIASPAAVALALVMVPETIASRDRAHEPDFKYHSTMDALSTGATEGLAIIWNIATMLIAMLALLFLVNAILGAFPDVAGAALSLQRILGWIFAPLMYLIGIPMEEAAKAGQIMGVKTVLTEFIAFLDLSQVPTDQMSDRTRLITTYAICGFANFGSMGILIGGLSIMCPERRPDFLDLAWKTLFAGTLATCLAAAVVASLPMNLFT